MSNEELWAIYAAAALSGRVASKKETGEADTYAAAAHADAMLAEHRRRFPHPVTGQRLPQKDSPR